jgi:hypothetical protein
VLCFVVSVFSVVLVGYGTPGGHGVACSLSLDGSTAAVLTASTVTETVQVPVSNSSTDSSTDSSTSSSSSGGTRQRLRALLQSLRSSSSSSSSAAGAATQQRRQRQRRLQQTSTTTSSSSDSPVQFKPITTTTRNAYLEMYAATAQGGPWAAVGTHMLDAAVAECILGAAPCRPLVDVSDKFAAVAYVNGPELKADVVFHNAPQAAASKKWAEFVKVCTLSKLLIAIGNPVPSADGGSKAAIAVPGEPLTLLNLFPPMFACCIAAAA